MIDWHDGFRGGLCSVWEEEEGPGAEQGARTVGQVAHVSSCASQIWLY